jgi:hypothetical protein
MANGKYTQQTIRGTDMTIKLNRYIGNPENNEVTVNGQPLDLCLKHRNHSPSGFSWGYGGSGPAQLALAIMIEEYGDDLESHPLHYQQLKELLIADLEQGKDFELTSSEIRECIRNCPA